MAEKKTQAPASRNASKISKNDISLEENELRKCLPRNMPRRKNDVYVNNKTDFKAQLKRCEDLLNSGECHEIFIHGLGNAMSIAINLSLRLQRSFDESLIVCPHTSTVELADDPKEAETHSRNNSAIHIKVLRRDSYHMHAADGPLKNGSAMRNVSSAMKS